MEKMILSLKSIYKMLLTSDYPIYSESVIGKKNRKGQTLLRFWNSILAEEFRCLPCGKMLWRNDGSRNRYVSNLCNRSEELKLYCEYANEIASQVSVSTLLNQIQRFSDFLLNREYKYDILMRRIRESARLWEEEDICLTAEIKTQICEYASNSEWNIQYGTQGRLFQAGYLLSLLTLYAAAGEAMGDPVMAVLRSENCTMNALWEAQSRQREQKHNAVTFLTAHNSLLQDSPLSPDHFFGREEALFDLQEAVAQKGKYLISGIGGIGKTEMLRQLIRRCAEEHTADKIVAVSYQIGIAESFERAFPAYHLGNSEDTFRYILLQLQKEADNGRVMILLDNLSNGMEEDPNLRRLLDLPCAVLITSRQTKLEGFEIYHLAPPSAATGTLIFRDNYQRTLTPENRESLAQLLQSEMLCHPLTLRLMARAANSKNWSVVQLKDHLLRSGVSLVWVDKERTVRLQQMYDQLYSLNRIPKECRELANLFTLLPLDSYSAEFLEKVFPCVTALAGGIGKLLEALVNGGWLDNGENGYFMHTLIAQCLRRKVLTESRLADILQDLHHRIPDHQSWVVGEPVDENTKRICGILIHISQYLTGNVSRQVMLDILSAMGRLEFTGRVKEQYGAYLTQMLQRCPERDDTVDICYGITLGSWNCGDPVLFEDLYSRQKMTPTVPRGLFLTFCVTAGRSIAIVQRPDLMEKLLREGLCGEAAAGQKGKAYCGLAEKCRASGDLEGALQWGQQAKEYMADHAECGIEIRMHNLATLCASQLEFGHQQEAGELLEQLQSLLEENPSPLYQINCEDLAGHYEMSYGSMEKALQHFDTCMKVLLEYEGMDRNYILALNKAAVVLQRMGRSEEAAQKYHTITSWARQANDVPLLHMSSNNLAVLYLDQGKAGEAIPHLEDALTFARRQGGVALGEVLKNMARAYGLLGDPAKEYQCLREASPLLDEAYGLEHPRASAARKRLLELAGSYKE